MNDSPWDALGIEPTKETAAIRRAYADKLKTHSPEVDPAGFQRVRAAYEWAMRYARTDHSPPVSEPQPSAGVSSPEPSAANNVSETTATVANTEQQQLREQYVRLQQLLSQAATDDELISAYRTLAQSPAMHNLSVHAEVESALAHLLATQIPTSDPLLDQAAAQFGWRQHAATISTDKAVHAIVRRLDDLQWLQQIQHRDHALREAVIALRDAPNPYLLNIWMMFAQLELKVLALLRELQHYRPGLADKFDARALKWWQEHLSKPRLSRRILGLSMIPALLAAFVAAGAESPLSEPLRFVLAFGMVSVSALIVCAFKVFSIDRPRQWWWTIGAKLPHAVWLEFAPLPLALLMLVVAMLLPDWDLVGYISLGVSIAGYFWLRATTPHGWPRFRDKSLGELMLWLLNLGLPLLLGFYALQELFITKREQVAIAGICLILIERLIRERLYVRLWQPQPVTWKNLFAKVVGMTAIALFAASLTTDSHTLAGMTAALGILVFLAHQPLVFDIGQQGLKIRNGLMIAAVIVATLSAAPLKQQLAHLSPSALILCYTQIMVLAAVVLATIEYQKRLRQTA